MKKTISCLSILIFQINFLIGQEFYFKHYKVEDGLSHNTVMSSLQDQKGFLWFGTKNGLNRFDGYTFRLFQNNPQDPTSLQGNYVVCLHEFKNSIWIGTDNGLFRYNDQYENFEILPKTANLQIFDIDNDLSGNLWYIAQNSLYKYDPDSSDLIHYPIEDSFNPTDIIRTIDDEIWVASNNSLFHYDQKTDSFKKYTFAMYAGVKNPFRINRLFSLDKETLLIGTANHGVIVFDIVQGKIKQLDAIAQDNYYVRNFALKGEEELWVASESGLHIYNLKTKSHTNLTKSYDDPYTLSDNAVYCLTVDSEGGVWAGTYFGGISYQPMRYSPFKKFFPMLSKNSISGNAVREIKPDAYGNIWIGTEDAGLNKYNPKTGIFTHYTSSDRKGMLSHYNIHGLLPRADKVWIGMFESGLDILDIKTDRIVKHYNIAEQDISRDNFVFALHDTKAKELVALTTNAILIYNAQNDNFEPFEGFPYNKHYACFFEDNEGVFWAGTYSDGLFYYNPHTKEKGSFRYNDSDGSSLAHNHINGIYQDSNSNIWITTENGLNLLNPDKKGFKKFSVQDGFPSNVFYAVLEDQKGNLWISTANGLVEFDVQKDIKKIYTKVNGLLSDQFNYNSAYKDPEGNLYFGSVNGMISFNPVDFKKNTFSPPIYITGLQIDNKEVYVGQEDSPISKSITLLDHLVLSPSQSSFSLEFAALAYTAPKSTEYWYKMEGLNTEWVNLQKDHKVNFTQLAAGTYYFSVKSMNKSGVWGQETTKLKIEVLPVFWKSNMAYLGYTFLILTLTLLGFKLYHQRIKDRNDLKIKQLNNKKEKEIYEAKIEFFTNISHEIRTPLTLIKSPLEKLLKNVDHPPHLMENLTIMEKNTSRLLDLANQLLDFRKMELESVNLTFVEKNISDILRQTYTRFSQAIKEKGLSFELVLEPEDLYAHVDVETLKKILSNLFSNAIKYAKDNVRITLLHDQEHFEITFKNDGKLIPSHLKDKIFEPFYRIPGAQYIAQPGTGLGLSLARSLTELHHGKLQLDPSDNKMNTFRLNLPIRQEKEFRLYISQASEKTNINQISNTQEPGIHKPTILLVEDNLDLLDFLGKDLLPHYWIIKATNGEKAIETLKHENVQLVVSDVMMPIMDGFKMCEIIKTNLETSHIPVILLTSKSAVNARIEGLESGADAYIEKPFSMEHLKAQIANLLDNRRNIMQYYSSTPLAHIRSIAHTELDESFIQKLDEMILENMSDPDLNVEALADIMNMSRSTLYRKIKEMSDLSPNELINVSRLKKSVKLLRTGNYKIFEVAEIVGYNSATSFGRNFQKQFNMTPTEYMNRDPEA